MQPVVDTHCHLDARYFPDGPDPVLKRAQSAGVAGFVVIGVGETLDAARNAIALAGQHPTSVAATAGLHPHDASRWSTEFEAELKRLAHSPLVVAIGETGLDYHYDHSPRETQQLAFRRQVALARDTGKPLVIHTRTAPADTLEILRTEGARDVGGVIHCFSENYEFARAALEMGFLISFSGILTFRSAHDVHDTARRVPLESILVETDSPYLAPVPFRGRTCEPMHVIHTVARLAELRGDKEDIVRQATTKNAERLFRRNFSAAASSNQ